MSEHRIERRQFIGRPRAEVFDFFSRAENLELITPPWLGFKLLSLSTPTIEAGTLIHYRLRLHGFPLHWTSRIARWDPPHGFIDEQIEGPYRLWHHEHGFVEQEGGTLITDRVQYSLPLGLLGDMAHGLLVRRDVEGIFAYRSREIERRFGAG